MLRPCQASSSGSRSRPSGFMVPGLIAAMVAELFMARAFASPCQIAARAGHLERRFTPPHRRLANRRRHHASRYDTQRVLRAAPPRQPREGGLRADFPVVKLDVLVLDALTLMEEAGVDLLPVLDGDASSASSPPPRSSSSTRPSARRATTGDVGEAHVGDRALEGQHLVDEGLASARPSRSAQGSA